nr:triple gene block protein 2 [Cowpea mild mottle virus]
MPLTAPPDYTKAFTYLVIGLSICVGLYTLTRHTTPIAGDNIHRLPFGGCYKDGTKSILYNRPGLSSQPFLNFGKLEAFLMVVIISGLIVFSSSRKAKTCHVCGREH